MEISEYVINAASAIVAMEYIDYGFQKKYCVQIPVKRCAHSEINGVAIPM